MAYDSCPRPNQEVLVSISMRSAALGTEETWQISEFEPASKLLELWRRSEYSSQLCRAALPKYAWIPVCVTFKYRNGVTQAFPVSPNYDPNFRWLAVQHILEDFNRQNPGTVVFRGEYSSPLIPRRKNFIGPECFLISPGNLLDKFILSHYNKAEDHINKENENSDNRTTGGESTAEEPINDFVDSC